MRGKELKNPYLNAIFRITPAYAGKRIKEICVSYEYGDHPRLCGEKFSGIWENIKGVGSPPPMRGKVAAQLRWQFPERITPAYAGKSVSDFHSDCC